MTAVPMLIVQPGDDDPPGPLADWLTEAGAELTVCRPFEEPLPVDLAGYQALVVLGGDMGALDDADYPWLADVRALLSTAVTRKVPVLAICLGAELLAVATGGRTRMMPDGPEVGTRLVGKRDAAAEDPLWGELPLSPDVIQFHKDEVSTLPPGATLLASAPRCENQAYRLGGTAYAVQFHIETTAEVVQRWAQDDPETAAVAPRHFEPGHLAAVHRDIEETWRPFAARFVRMAAGELAPAPTPLPLAR